MIKIHYAVCFKILVTLWSVCGAIYGGMISNKVADPVKRFTSGGRIIVDHGKLILIERFI